MRLSPLVASLLAVALSPPALALECGKHGELRDPAIRLVELGSRAQDPVFYYRSDRFAILMKTAHVQELLESKVRRWDAPGDARLLAAILNDLPLTGDTDLVKYVLSDTDLLDRTERVAADLLESGKASLVDLWGPDRGDLVSRVRLLTNSSGGKWREFCTLSGVSILIITDLILD
jgi:hypothetical protein